jgi:SAM-dependent methyltransferase
MYLRGRLGRRPPGKFVDVGVGAGLLSRELLRLGWHGEGWDLSEEAVRAATATNRAAIASGRYRVHHGDWLEQDPARADLVVASMVLEHLEEEGRFLGHCHRSGGQLVLLVPASPRHWGIEDEIAGHLRRYTRGSLRQLLQRSGFVVSHLVGLTFPVSNVLLPLSNLLVRRAEAHKLDLAASERTRRSGIRQVPFKTVFPLATGILLNRVALYPFHLAQKATRGSERALVLYAEAFPRH